MFNHEISNDKKFVNPYIISAMIDCVARNNNLDIAENIYN